MRALCLALLAGLLLPAATAGADEFRMKDGEVVHGTLEETSKGRLRVRTPTGLRKLRADWLDERIEAEDPAAALAGREAALAADDAGARAVLARFAWQHRMDADARRLAEAAIALDAGQGDAQRLLGRVPSDGGWDPGRGRTWERPLARWGLPKRQARARGGTASTEQAATAGLAWLARHQDADGKIDADGFQRHDPPGDQTDGQGGGHHGERVACAYDGVVTAVALMAWLASGSTPVSGPYKENVAGALRWCVARIQAGSPSAYGMWNHGFCTQAVADALLVTRDPALVPVLERAVAGILRLQQADGGWSYYMAIGDVPTTGVAGCALGLALQAGVPLPGGAVDRLLAFLAARVAAGSGRSEYHEGAERKGYTPTRANTAAGLAVRALLGRQKTTPLLGKQCAALTDRKPVWKLDFKEVKTKDGRTVRAQIGTLYPYLWYYTTMALFERGGATWTKWFGGVRTALVKGQRKDGAASGSWDPLGTYSSSGGRAFVTGLCVLMLQAPYRYPRSP